MKFTLGSGISSVSKALTLAIAVSVTALIFTASAAATTLTVDADNSSNYDSIQKAIDNASQGATIEVRSGIYNESISFSSDDNGTTITSVDGQGAAEINASDHAVLIGSNPVQGVTIDGFEIDPGSSRDGIRVRSQTSNLTVANNTINNKPGRKGIWFSDATDNLYIINNTVTVDSSEDAVIIGGKSTASGTPLLNNVVVKENHIDAGDEALKVEGAVNAKIRNNNISSYGDAAIQFADRGNVTGNVSVKSNRFGGGMHGILIHNKSTGDRPTTAKEADFDISGNSFKDNSQHLQDDTGGIDTRSVFKANSFDKAVFVDSSGSYLPIIWSSIQKAVDSASKGDTVEVSEGKYIENVTVNTSDIVLTSSGKKRNTEVAGQMIVSSDNVTVRDLTISPDYSASTNSNAEAFRISNSPDNVTVESNIVENFDSSGLPKWEGVDGIVAFGGDETDPIENIVIRDNKVRNISGRDKKGGVTGISIQGNVKNATVANNEISGIGKKRTAWALATVVRGTGNHNKVPQTVEILDNTIENIQSNPNTSTKGVGIENEADATEILARGNIINNTKWGAENKDSKELNATRNYWGDNTGPYNASTNPSATGEKFVGNVTYSPWLESDGTVRDHNVEVNGSEFNSIQAAEDAASSGETVKVMNGEYEEAVEIDTVNLTVTSISGNNSTTVRLGNGNGGTSTMNLKARGSTVKGFHIVRNGTSGDDASWSQAIALRASYTKAVNNHVDYFRKDGKKNAGIMAIDNGSSSPAVKNLSIKGNNVEGSATNILATTFYGGGLENVDIYNNTVKDGGIAGITIKRHDGTKTLKDIDIRGNTVKNNGIGLYLPNGTYAGLNLDDFNSSEVLARKNIFEANSKGAANEVFSKLDARRNYWGSETGPGGAGTGVGDNVTGNVTFTPWYPEESMTSDIAGNTVEPGENTTLEVGDSNGTQIEVTVSTSENGSTSVKKIGSSPSKSPDQAENFIGGVDVQVKDTSNKDIPDSNESGTIRISYNQSEIQSKNVIESDIQVYLQVGNDWVSPWDETVNEEENYVEADVPHFSTYAAYGAESSSGDGGDNTQLVSDGGTGVVDEDPNAVIIGDPTVYVGDLIRFSANETTDDLGIENYSWSFGDGITAEGVKVEHSFNQTGNYTVELRVEDTGGNTDTETLEVEVTQVPSEGQGQEVGTSQDKSDIEDIDGQQDSSSPTGFFTASQSGKFGLGLLLLLLISLTVLQRTGKYDFIGAISKK